MEEINTEEWSRFSSVIDLELDMDYLMLYPSSSLSANSTNEIYFLLNAVDDICLTDLEDNPMRARIGEMNNLTYAINGNDGSISSELEFWIEYEGTNNQDLYLDIEFPQGEVFDIDLQSEEVTLLGTTLKIDAGTLSQEMLSVPLSLEFDGSQESDVSYGVELFMNEGGVLCHKPWVYIIDSSECTGQVEVSGALDGCVMSSEDVLSYQYSGNGSVVDVHWDLPNGETVNSEFVSFNGLGSYTVDVVDDLGCTYSNSIEIVLQEACDPCGLAPDFYYQNDVLYQGGLHQFSGASTILDGNLIVDSGSLLVLNDAEISFTYPHSFIVREGAEVIVTNSHLTNCDYKWNGVKVQSDNMTNENSGSFQMIGGSISNASIAIETEHLSGIEDFLDSEAGQILCDDVTFHNNQTSLIVTNNSGLNQDEYQVMNCRFILDDEMAQYSDSPSQQRQVVLGRCVDFNLYNCLFDNQMTGGFEGADILGWSNLGAGIKTNSKSKIVDCHFKRFCYGIYMFPTFYSVLSGTVIENNVFEKNKIGIFQLSTIGTEVINNDFYLGEPSTNPVVESNEYHFEGVVFDGCGYFEIQENSFWDETLFGSVNGTIGVRNRDLVGSDGRVRNNQFTNLDYACLANGNNTSNDGTGLRYLCNTYNNCCQDIYVAEFPGGDIPSIGANQGVVPLDEDEDPWTDAGNTFSPSSSCAIFADERMLKQFATSPTIDYYAFVGDYPSPESLLMTTTNVDFGEENIGSIDNTCPTEFLAPNEIESALEEWEDSSLDAEDEGNVLEYIYESMLDGGDSEQLQNEVDFAWSEDVWDMRDELLSLSPNVSKKTLYKVADKTDVFPHPVAFEIFMANPDVLRDVRFLRYLEYKATPMPDYMIDLLRLASNQSTFRTALMKQLASARTRETEAKTKWMHLLRKANRGDEVWDVVATMDDLDSDLLMAEYELDLGNNTMSQNWLSDAYDRANPYYVNEVNEIDQFDTWMTLKSEVVQDYAGDWTALNASQMSTLTNLAEEYNTLAGKRAMSVLNAYHNADYFIPPAFGGEDFEWRSATTEVLTLDDAIKIYPNPADVILNVEVDFSLSDVLEGFLVFNALGEKVAQRPLKGNQDFIVLDTRGLESGTYFYSITSEKRTIKSGKFEVLH